MKIRVSVNGTMQEREVELIGPLPDKSAHGRVSLEQAGIHQDFAPELFQWDPEQNRFVCPAGNSLPHWKDVTKDRGRVYHLYRAAPAACAACPNQHQCVQLKQRQQGQGRMVARLKPDPVVDAHRVRMATEVAQAAYKKRGAVAEFPNACLKEKMGLRKFRLRGLTNVNTEALWACLAYNVLLWRRSVWLTELSPAPAA